MADPRIPRDPLDRLAARLEAMQAQIDKLKTPSGSAKNQTVSKLTGLIDNIQAQLDQYIATGTYNRTQLDAKFDAKANTSHTHSADDITSGTLARPISTTTGAFSGTASVGGTLTVGGRTTSNAGITSTDVRNRTLATGYAAVYADVNGVLGISPSILEKKSILSEYVPDVAAWRALRPKMYYLKDDPTKTPLPGFVAELLTKFPELQLFDGDGKLQGLKMDLIAVALHSVFVQFADSTDARLDKLEKLLTTRLGI